MQPAPGITTVTVYTDGSCHTQLMAGCWVAILLAGTEKTVLNGCVNNTTHQQMELMAVIKALEYIHSNYPAIHSVTVITDSQYVTGLPDRKEKLTAGGFVNSKGYPIQNALPVQELYHWLSRLSVTFKKIKAHAKSTEAINYNREADMLCRRLVREMVNGIKKNI